MVHNRVARATVDSDRGARVPLWPLSDPRHRAPFLSARIVREGQAPMTMTELWPGAPRVVGPADLGAAAAFTALVTQGYLREIWNGRAVASDVPVTPAIRADALFGSLSTAARRCVIGRASAVWIHTGAHRPRRADLLVPAGVRIPAPEVGHMAHETRLDPDEWVTVGPLRVTSICRTAADVARWLPLSVAAALLATLADHPHFDGACAAAVLAREHGHRGVRHALTVLESMGATAAQAGSPAMRAPRDPVMR